MAQGALLIWAQLLKKKCSSLRSYTPKTETAGYQSVGGQTAGSRVCGVTLGRETPKFSQEKLLLCFFITGMVVMVKK